MQLDGKLGKIKRGSGVLGLNQHVVFQGCNGKISLLVCTAFNSDPYELRRASAGLKLASKIHFLDPTLCGS